MKSKPDNNSTNVYDQVRKLSRDFGKQISLGKPPRIQKYLPQIPEEGREDLFTNLLAMEINFRRGKGEFPTSDEYVKRFPRFKKQVRRAFFEPTMGSVDSRASSDGDDQTALHRSPEPAFDALEQTHELPDAKRLGDYELIRKLGQGGMGIVYEALHARTNNRVALKTLPTGGDGQQVNADKLYRFRKEFRRLSEINHPNLVGMQSLEVDGDNWFFTMDLIDGEDFLTFVRPDEQLDETRLRQSLKQLATGVMELHRRGIIHRDLKPSNVLVSPKGHVTILDFGLAAQLQRAGDMTQTRSGLFAGTPPYAAPEQMFGERTEASDWYAFGTMLYEALAGERPFQDPDPMKLLRIKQEQDPPSLSDHDGLPDELSELADGLLRRKSGLRLSSDAIGAALGLDDETRIPGSTRGSQGSAGSVDAEEEEWISTSQEYPLIGRDKQLKLLQKAKQQLFEGGHPVIAWVSGLSGEGKSALVESFLQSLRQQDDLLVLSGRCYDRESIPLKALDSQIDPLVRFLRTRSESDLSDLLPRDIERLAQLFPLLRRVDAIEEIFRRPQRRIDEKELRSLGVAALGDLLANISERFPLIMFIDDLQWADAESARILAQVLKRAQPPRLLFVGSFRSDETENSLFLSTWNAQFDSSEAPGEFNVSVSPLSETECLDYIRTRIGQDAEVEEQELQALVENTKGNPYFLEQLVAGFDSTTGQFHAVPLEKIIKERLSACPAGATEILHLLAVAGKAVEIPELSEMLDEPGQINSALAHMQSARLVRRIGGADDQLIDTYHDKIRETVLENLSDQQSRDLNLRFGEFLESKFTVEDAEGTRVASGDRVFDLARHFSQAADPRAFRYHLQAGEESLQVFAMDVAAQHFQEAIELCPSDISTAVQFRIHYGYGRSLLACHQSDEAIGQFDTAIQYAENRLMRAECHLMIGEAEWKRSHFEQAEKSIARSFAEMSERNPRTVIGRIALGSVYLLAFLFFPSRFYFRIRRLDKDEIRFLSQAHSSMWWQLNIKHLSIFLFHTARGCLIAKCSHDVQVRQTAFSTMGAFLSLAGGWPIAALMMWRSRRGKKSNEYHPTLGVAELNEMNYAYAAGNHEQVSPHYQIAVEELDRTGNYQRSAPDHFMWHTHSYTGNPAGLIHHARKEIAIARQSNDQIVEAWGKYGLAEGLARTGRIVEGSRQAEESIELLEAIGTWTETIGRVQYAKILMQAGDYSAAKKEADVAVSSCWNLRLMELTSPAFPVLVEASCGSAWHSLDQRKPNSPARLKRFIALFARLLGFLFPNIKSHSLRASGRRAMLKGNRSRAIRFFDRAIKVAGRMGAEYELARALIDKSMVLTEDAEPNRKRGLDLLESLGCVLPEAEVEYLGIDRQAHHDRAAKAHAQHEAEVSTFD